MGKLSPDGWARERIKKIRFSIGKTVGTKRMVQTKTIK